MRLRYNQKRRTQSTQNREPWQSGQRDREIEARNSATRVLQLNYLPSIQQTQLAAIDTRAGRTIGRLLAVRFVQTSTTFHIANKLYHMFGRVLYIFGVLDGRDKEHAESAMCSISDIRKKAKLRRRGYSRRQLAYGALPAVYGNILWFSTWTLSFGYVYLRIE